MKKIGAFLFVCMILFIACRNKSNDREGSHEKINTAEFQQCYSYIFGNDTVFMKLGLMSSVVTGELEYHLFEKDQNTGTLLGYMKGDTLIATYTFISEGTSSKREVVFLKREDDFIEGYGEVMEKEDGIYFINHNQLHFDTLLPLKMVSCAKLLEYGPNNH